MLTSCTDNLFNEVCEENANEKVTLTFKTNIPETSSIASRSFDKPSVETLHLIVFDNNGYFVEKQEATKKKKIVDDTEVTEFSVTLIASASRRTIHFIGNYAGADNLQFGSESDIIGELKHSNGADAYWQRMSFGSISDDTQIGTIPLLRNHARVTVTESLDNFELESFTVVNIVNEGYVAPYNQNSSNFAQFLETDENGNLTSTPLDYSAITTGPNAYTGYMPNVEVSVTSTWDWVTPNNYFYLYEQRFDANKKNAFVIVKGKYNGQQSSYYKIEIVDNNKNYYHILRNFEYKIQIKDVTGNGKEDATAAYDMTGSHNNLVASVELQSLSNISDGLSQLYVSYTEEHIVSSDPVTLQYMYIPSIANKGNTSNGDISIEYTQNGDVIKTCTIASSNDDSGWRTITITPQSPDANETKKQTLTIKAENLQRTITYILHTPYNLGVQCYDGNGTNKSDKVVNASIQQKVNVDITIPSGLPESIFPLTFYIEAEKRTLYPDAVQNQIPVETKVPSLFTGGATFGYTKEVTWEEYYTNGIYNTLFTCYFLTNTEENASNVRVYNKYFNVKEDSFENPPINAKFENEQYYGKNKTVALILVIKNAGTYTLSSENGSLTFNSASGATLSNNILSVSENQINKEIRVTCTTQTWANIAEATITPVSPTSGTSVKVMGETRNKILIPANAIKTNGEMGSSDRDIYVTLSSSYDNPIGSFKSRGNGSNTDSFELSIDDLGDNTEDWNNKTVYFYFSRSSGYRYAKTSLTNIMNIVMGNSSEVTINFNTTR